MCSSDNYSDMSDFEINIEVAKVVGYKPLDETNGWKGLQEPPFSAVICKGPQRVGGFDPCNLWADAGPIIEREKIQLFCENEVWDCRGYNASHKPVDYAHRNPLRAAMITYLMMVDDQNGEK